MNVEVRSTATIASIQASRLAIADCDMHLGPRSLDELKPFLSSRILHHIETYGMAHRVPWQDGNPAFPKSAPYAARRDAFPPSGRSAGHRSGVHPRAASGSVQRATRGGQSAVAVAELHEPRSGERDVPRVERVADRGAGAAGASAARLDRGELRGSVGRGCGDRALRGHAGLWPHPADEPHRRTARARVAMRRYWMPPLRRVCRWRCMRSASPGIRQRRPAGRRSTSRTWLVMRRASRRISPAW